MIIGGIPMLFGGKPPLAVDAASTASASATSLTWSHTCAGANRALIVGIAHTGPGDGATISSVTYNGVALTLIGGRDSTNGVDRVEQWKLSNPPLGANNVVITATSLANLRGGAISFTGAHQTTASLTGTQATATAALSNPVTVNVSSAAGEIVIDTAALREVFGAVGAGQTSRWTSAGSNPYGAGSTELGASTTTMSWTCSGTAAWVTCGVSVKPSA